MQSKKIDLADYEVVSIEGEAHAQTFQVSCEVNKLKIKTQGEGTSRRNAEQQAAQLALEVIFK
jgi:ribonuclease-3